MKPLRTCPYLSCVVLGVALFALPGRADEADDQYAVAAGHYAQERWKFAAEEFQAFLAKYPNDNRARESLFFLGEALVQLGRHEEAQSQFQEYLRRDPNGPHAQSALYRAGETAYLAGKMPEAKSLLRQFLEKHAGDDLNAHVLPYLGEIALAERDIAGAESYFRQGLSRFPEGRLQDDCRFGLARSLERQDKNAESEKFYLALAGKPSSRLAADAQLRLGAVQYALGKYAEAAESFAAFEAKGGGNAQLATAQLGRGWALMKLDRAKEAADLFQKIAADPKLGIEARYWLGLAQKTQKEWTAAAKTLLEAASANPKSPLAAAIRFHAGDALLHAGDYAAAREQFDAVVRSAAGQKEWIADSMLGICQAALRQKDFEAIDRQAAEFSRRFPSSPLGGEVQRLFARSLIERKQFQKAADVLGPLAAAGGQGGQGIEERYLLALAYEGLKRYDDAMASLKPVLASTNESLKADAQLIQASVFMGTKRFSEAIAPLEAFLAGQPAPEAAVKARSNLAVCLARTKQLDKAKKLYAALVEKHPEHELTVPMTEQLAEAAYEAGDTAWSQELFARLAKQGPAADKQMAGLAGLGWSQFKAGNLEEAAATFGQVLAKKPDPALAAETALVRGQILEKLKKTDDALAMYDLVIGRHPTSNQLPQALLAAARLRHALQQNEQAAALLKRLTKEFPKFPEMDAALYDWAWVLADQGKLTESAEVFERLRREFPQGNYWSDATFRLAQREFAAKQFARARELAGAVLGRNPESTVRENAMYLLAQIAAGEEKWQEARDAFESLARQFPSGSLRLLAEYGAAEAVFRLGDFEAARTRFQQLAGEAHGRDKAISAVALLRQAQAFSHQEKWEAAYRLASQVESAFPGFEEQYEVDYILGRCLANRAEFEKAREAYRRAIVSPGGKKTKTAANAQLMIAETYFHQKNFESALREYLKVEILYAFPAVQAAALVQAGKCHESLGEWKQAAEVYTRIAGRYGDTTFARVAAERLKAAEKRAEEKQSK
jgi:TolA-binding protein